MDWKKLGKALLFPHIAVMIILLPIATVFLVYSMVFLGTESIGSSAAWNGILASYLLVLFSGFYLVCPAVQYLFLLLRWQFL